MDEPRKPDIVLEELIANHEKQILKHPDDKMLEFSYGQCLYREGLLLGELLISIATEKLSIWKDRLSIYANKKQWNESEKAEYINSLKNT